MEVNYMSVLSKKIKTNVLGLAILGLLTSGSVKAGFLSNAGAFFSTAGDKLSTGATWLAGQLREPVCSSGRLQSVNLGVLGNKLFEGVPSVSRGNLIAALGVPAVAVLLFSRRKSWRIAALALATALAGTSFAFGHHKTGAGYVAAIFLVFLIKSYREARKALRGGSPDGECQGLEMVCLKETLEGKPLAGTYADDHAIASDQEGGLGNSSGTMKKKLPVSAPVLPVAPVSAPVPVEMLANVRTLPKVKKV